MREFQLPLPNLSEQKVIVGRIDTAFARVDRLASATTNARKLIDHLDQAILAKPPTRAAKNVGVEKSVKSLGGQKEASMIPTIWLTQSMR